MVTLVQLPLDILINIFKYLDIVDIIKLYEMFDNNIRDVCAFVKLKYININATDYNFPVTYMKSKYLNKHNLHNVTHLNINSLYWISSSHLRRMIGYMPKLESLYAVDTSLSLNPSDLILYNKLEQLKDIAITVNISSLKKVKISLPQIKRMSLYIFNTSVSNILRIGNAVQPNLTFLKLVLFDFPECSEALLLEALERIHTQHLKIYDVNIDYGTTVRYRRTEESNVTVLHMFSSATPKVCLMLFQDEVLSITTPCKLQFLDEKAAELNKAYIKTVHIRKCIKGCNFKDPHENKLHVLKEFKNVERFIASGFLVGHHGSYIPHVFAKWSSLTSVNIVLEHHDISLYHNLMRGFQCLQNLNDLRLVMYFLPFNDFFKSFPQRHAIRRIFLDGNIFEELLVDNFDKFLNARQQQLIFAVFQINGVTEKVATQCRRIMTNYAAKDNKKIYLFGNIPRPIQTARVPMLHLLDMIKPGIKTFQMPRFHENDDLC